jgi:flavin reductase (DIM6/NTAB) family NADH-FMN oxidoreductase RutF
MSQAFDMRDYRSTLGQFTTGVTVIATTEPDGAPRGFTANSFTSVSLAPPLLLICVAKSAASHAVFCQAPFFSINILAEEHKVLSQLFASQRPDKFDVAPWNRGMLNLPLIEGALAWFECERQTNIDAGDHEVLIGRVRNFGRRQGLPLGYHAGRYVSISGAAPPPQE